MYKVKEISEDRLFYFINNAFLLVFFLIILLPLIYIVSASFSDPNAVVSGEVWLYPVRFTLNGYEAVFKDAYIISGYANTILYTVAGTALNIVITIIAAYPLSRVDLKGRNIIMFVFSFTMLFNGGLIPTYILMRDLHLINSRLVMIIPGALGIWNMIIARTYYQSTISPELLEASQIDGCSDFRFIWSIVLPLSKAITAVLVMFYAVGHWNAFFDAFLYLSDKKLYPLQLILRDILIMNTINPMSIEDPELLQAKQGLAQLLKYSLIIVASVPVLCLYPFIQKYFVKGVMIGSIKG